jgi:hypothetical protein
MAIYKNTPPIVTNGLLIALDAANPMSYTSGSTIWRDISGNNISGSLVNGPTFSSIYGGSIIFDGVNDRIQTSTTLPVSSSFTIEYAVSISELPTAGEYNYIYQNGSGYQINGVYAEFGPGPYMTLCQVNSSSIAAGVGLTTTPQANRLYYITVTYENRSLKGYTYGIPTSTNNISFDPLNGTTGTFFIGSIGPLLYHFGDFIIEH